MRLGADNRKSRCVRFTLLELMIALAIMVMLAALTFAASNSVTRSWSRIQKRQTQFSNLMTLDRTLDRVLSNAVPFVWRDEENQKFPFFYGDRNWTQVAYRHRIVSGRDGGLRFISLFLQDGELRAVYQQRPFLTTDEMSEYSKASVLARGVAEFYLSYADINSDGEIEWLEVWDPFEWEPVREEIPLAVMATVVWQDGRRETWLRRTSGNSKYERYGNWRPRTVE